VFGTIDDNGDEFQNLHADDSGCETSEKDEDMDDTEREKFKRCYRARCQRPFDKDSEGNSSIILQIASSSTTLQIQKGTSQRFQMPKTSRVMKWAFFV